ncbi:MAG: HlyD family efflux transporter periplasmic adaptor subunit [Croceibacterium sp.]
MNKKRLLMVAAVVALAIAAFATRGFGLLAKSDQGPLKLYGNVDIREVDMAFRVPGRIDEIQVEEGAKVRQGALLASLDTATVTSRANQATAAIEQARANLDKLRNGNRPQEIGQARARLAGAQAAARAAAQDVSRRRALVEPGAISRDVWEQTLAQRDTAEAQLAEARQSFALVLSGARREDIAAAEAQLRSAEANGAAIGTDLSDTRLVAKTDGSVVTRAREPGAIVQAGETVLTLSLDRPLRVRSYIAEPDLSRIAPGMRALVTADGNAKTYHGTIGYISPRSEFTPKSVETENLRTDLVYRLNITVTDPDDALRQGQPVTVAVPSARPAKH